ncbi:hypothetical protein [Singulisphaera acidiphila]|uniref:Uncharacterized protein n=1 Tax=Singulisphaera acidiphila (strain ATCC BAA-1392 / DSM 18658 / VKM B-2454 / MOB10) TaxID=886293 RepID=L0DGT7_SINAD|nr:hypothetical protein [Singulisphaera acidiphila]AGA27866.1 hypothetical protein Sinac_3617 [Singulisphaera acidiphila DSM 18658]
MSQKSRAFRPAANSLESRITMSATTVRPLVQNEVTSLATTNRITATSGTLSGRYLATDQDNRAADAPLQVNLDGSGKIQGLGRSTMTGVLNFGGFGLPNQPDLVGTVKISNAKGSITVQLSGSGGHSQIPNGRFALKASIVSGTGAYTNLRGIGTANALFGKNTARSITTPSPIGGTLTLALNLKPPIR